MEKTLPIVEIFKSIQGEGRYQGHSVIFVRSSSCTRKCFFCDTSYHVNGKPLSVKQVVSKIKKLKLTTVVFTGGEPLLWINQIAEIKEQLPKHNFHLESNADLVTCKSLEFYCKDFLLSNIFSYICLSPKELKVAEKVSKVGIYPGKYDIKIVTDLDKVGVDMLEFATMLMPLSTYDYEKDIEIRQKVWNYCVEHNLLYSGRLHVEIWGKRRKV